MDSYKKAAIAYLLYACVYIVGAWLRMSPERMGEFHGVSWYWFFVGGALLLIIIPFYISKKAKWLTRIFAFGPTVKAGVLFYREGKTLLAGAQIDPFNLFFAFIAASAAILMFRAGWGKQ